MGTLEVGPPRQRGGEGSPERRPDSGPNLQVDLAQPADRLAVQCDQKRR